MHYKKERIYDYELDFVVNSLMDSKEPLYTFEELPNVTQNKEIWREEKGNLRYLKVEWCAHGQIPKVAQKVVSPKMLTWIEESIWDKEKYIYSFKIKPFYFAKQIDCEGSTKFYSKGKNKCARLFDIKLRIHIPVVGLVLEMAILELLKKNEEEEYKLSLKALESLKKKQG